MAADLHEVSTILTRDHPSSDSAFSASCEAPFGLLRVKRLWKPVRSVEPTYSRKIMKSLAFFGKPGYLGRSGANPRCDGSPPLHQGRRVASILLGSTSGVPRRNPEGNGAATRWNLSIRDRKWQSSIRRLKPRREASPGQFDGASQKAAWIRALPDMDLEPPGLQNAIEVLADE
jgi:hypothetical protein